MEYMLILVSFEDELVAWRSLSLDSVISILNTHRPKTNMIKLYKVTNKGLEWIDPNNYPFKLISQFVKKED